MKHKTLTFIRVIVTSVFIVYAGVVTYWLLYPYNVIDVHSIVIQNQDKQVQQGGTLVYRIDYTKHVDMIGVVSRKLVNDYTIIYSDIPNMSDIGPDAVNIPLPVPEYASIGKYRLQWKVRYQVNPMRSVIETVWSDEFFVTPQAHIDEMRGEPGEQGIQGERGKKGEKGDKGDPSSKGNNKTFLPTTSKMKNIYPGGLPCIPGDTSGG